MNQLQKELQKPGVRLSNTLQLYIAGHPECILKYILCMKFFSSKYLILENWGIRLHYVLKTASYYEYTFEKYLIHGIIIKTNQ